MGALRPQSPAPLAAEAFGGNLTLRLCHDASQPDVTVSFLLLTHEAP